MAKSKSPRSKARNTTAKSKSPRAKARASTTTAKSKHLRHPKSTGRSSRREVAPRKVPTEQIREPSSESPYGARGSPRARHPDVIVDEETGAQSRRPGGPGDASFGDNDEGPEGPAR